MFTELATADSVKRAIAMPNTGDHVIASPIKSRDVAGVEKETLRFLEEVIHLRVKN
jgi:hypothetical protein